VIKLKIEATDGNDLRKQLQALLGTTALTLSGAGSVGTTDPVMPEVRAADETEAAKPVRASRKKVEPAKEPEGNEPASEGTDDSGSASSTSDDTKTSSTSTDATSDASPSDGEVTIEQIRELTLKVVDQCGKQKIEEVLSGFGVARATQVSEELRPELAAKLQEALDEAAG
jgi:hypothetical protein